MAATKRQAHLDLPRGTSSMDSGTKIMGTIVYLDAALWTNNNVHGYIHCLCKA